MIKILFIFALTLGILDARENPFFSISKEKSIPVTSVENRKKTPLQRATITLPSQARVLQKITVEFKSLDGSIESKSIELDNSIDWHLPLFISQSYPAASTAQAPIIKKENQKKEIEYEEIASIKYVKFYSSFKKIKLITDDKIIRNFLLVDPHRIVIDFKRDADIKSYSKKISNNIFNKIRIGNHKDYYRIVINLDGVYRYSMKQIASGYLLELE